MLLTEPVTQQKHDPCEQRPADVGLAHANNRPHVDAEQSGHPVEVIGVVGHSQHLGDDGVLSPLVSKLLHQFHEVAGGGLTDGVHWKNDKLLHENTIQIKVECNAGWKRS